MEVLSRAAIPAQTWEVQKALWLSPELQWSDTSAVPSGKKSRALWFLCTHLFSVLLVQLGTSDVTWLRGEFPPNYFYGVSHTLVPGHTCGPLVWRELSSWEQWQFQTCKFHDTWAVLPMFVQHVLILSFSFRLCDSFLYSYKAFWEELWEHCSWSGGACPRSCKILLSLHCLQKPPVCVPLASEVWEPEGVCKGEWLGGLWSDAADLWMWLILLFSSNSGKEYCCLHWVQGFRWSWCQAIKGGYLLFLVTWGWHLFAASYHMPTRLSRTIGKQFPCSLFPFGHLI